MSPMDGKRPLEGSFQCTATSKRSGERCKRPARRGLTVCYMHGGNTPVARDAAERRLLALLDPAIDALHKALASKDTRAVVQACRTVLDRAGFPKVSRVELEESARRVTDHQAKALATAMTRALDRLGIPTDDPSVQAVMRASLVAAGEDDWSPPENVHPVPREIAELLGRWWRGAYETPPLQLPADVDVVDAEVAE